MLKDKLDRDMKIWLICVLRVNAYKDDHDTSYGAYDILMEELGL